MRFRNIPEALATLEADQKFVIPSQTAWDNIKSAFTSKNIIFNLEIGMGKGLFLITQAFQNPHINFIGLDRSLGVLYKALKKIYRFQKENNYQFHNLKIMHYSAENLLSIFSEKTIDTIFLNFSDPWPKTSHSSRRLTHLKFLLIYQTILVNHGNLVLKTDNQKLYVFSIDQFSKLGQSWKIIFQTENLYKSPWWQGNVMTEYEQKFKALHKSIYLIQAQTK